MINYVLAGIILYLLYCLKYSHTEGFTDVQKQYMANELYKNKDKITGNYKSLKNKMEWLDPVTYSDSLELFRNKKYNVKNLTKIFD